MSDHKKLRMEVVLGSTKGFSMGCHVEQTVCGVCGETSPHLHKEPLMARKGEGAVKYEPFTKVQFLYASIDKAPTCEVCSKSMLYTKSGTEWACQNEECLLFGNAIDKGLGGVLRVL